MRQVLVIFTLFLFLTSCEKELDFHYHEVDSQLVIEGHTSDVGTSILLTRTCPMGKSMDVTPIKEAEIFLKDLTNNVNRKLNVDGFGVFRDTNPGIVGHDYKIEVLCKGNKYEASCVMHPATMIVNLAFQWIKMPYDYVAVLQISFLDLNSKDTCYWIKLYRNEEPYMWLLSDDRSAVNGVISEVTMTTRKDVDKENEKSILMDGDEVKVIVTPISRNMYDYLLAVQSGSNGPRMFKGDFCLGYYIASIESQKTIIFHPDNIDYFN